MWALGTDLKIGGTMALNADLGSSLGTNLGLLSEGLTYDDVLLVPQYSAVLPTETSLDTQLSRNIRIRAPIISAAMDTVTEARLAITMAQLGGVGILHKNMPPSSQAAHVRKVKKSESGMVTDPITVGPGATIGDVIAIMNLHSISGLPVVDHGFLVGIVTGRDIRFEKDPKRSVREVMTAKVITTPKGTLAEDAVDILHRHRIEKLPVIDTDGRSLIGMFTIKDIEKTRMHPHASKDAAGRLLVGAAIGAGGDALERAEALLLEGVDLIVVDTAHGHSEGVLQTVRALRKHLKKYTFDIIAGNVATPQGTLALIEAGADGIKVGMGPGSICTTRVIAGIGVPQLSAVHLCAAAALPHNIPIIADGGIRFSGDIVKGLAAGAGTVMVGSLFAGTDEAPGEMIIFQGKSYKSYRGMGSLGAMKLGSKDRYMQANVEEQGKLVPEGVEGRVPYRGPLVATFDQLVGGIRQGLGYTGCRNLDELRKDAKFIRISPAGLRESHVHDVYITREAPNYQAER